MTELTFSGKNITENELVDLKREHPTLKYLDIKHCDVAPEAMTAVAEMKELEVLKVPGWDDLQSLQPLHVLPNLNTLEVKFASLVGLVSVKAKIFEKFESLESFCADYWCLDDKDDLDELREAFPNILFDGYDSNFGELDDD